MKAVQGLTAACGASVCSGRPQSALGHSGGELPKAERKGQENLEKVLAFN